MSRHKLIKNMNLDDELDDFDGGGNYDDDAGRAGEEGMAPKEQSTVTYVLKS